MAYCTIARAEESSQTAAERAGGFGQSLPKVYRKQKA